jgi:3-deoxy-manno-octulosonate cytidylyltransferase (CMP-KDO synthetase)
MKTIAFIPARYHSTRFFRGQTGPPTPKPLALIHIKRTNQYKPMIQRVYECALDCRDLSEVYVTTDDERIVAGVEGFGGKVILTGKKHPSGTDRIAEAAKEMGLKETDLVVNIQGDQPNFHSDSISLMIAPLLENPDILMSTLMFPIRGEKDVQNPFNIKVVTDEEGFALYFSHSPIPCYRDGGPGQKHYKHLGFYAYSMDFLQKFASLPVGVLESAEKLEQLRALENGFRIKVIESPYDSIEIDRPEDIKRAEDQIAREDYCKGSYGKAG